MLIFDIRAEKDSKRCFFVVTVPVFLFPGAGFVTLNDLAGLAFCPLGPFVIGGIFLYHS